LIELELLKLNISIRPEQEKDYKQTEAIVEQAFANAVHSNQDEHKLVSRIRKTSTFIPELSLVAIDQESEMLLGHILLSKISINGNSTAESLALAPVSVLPDYQNKGIGKLLIQEALKMAKELGYHSVIVLGHPEYYPKFGFERASKWGIRAPFDVPDNSFMAMELVDNSLVNVLGIVEYPTVFFE
jgi:predicted N-acetyltransferase YhbS